MSSTVNESVLHKISQKTMEIHWQPSAYLMHHNILNMSERITAEKCYQQIDKTHQHKEDPILIDNDTRSHVAMITRQKLYELYYKPLGPNLLVYCQDNFQLLQKQKLL